MSGRSDHSLQGKKQLKLVKNERELRLKGNEAITEAAVAGVDAYFGYPVRPQSEVMEYLTLQNLRNGP